MSTQPPSYDQAHQQQQQQAGATQDSYVSYPPVYGSGDQSGNSSAAQGIPAYQSSQWGAPVMGKPANPSSHPDNQQAAMQQRPELKEGKGFDEPGVAAAATSSQMQSSGSPGNYVHHPSSGSSPYIQTSSIPSAPNKSPMDTILESLNKWSKKAEYMAENVWNHLKTGPSMTDAAWGKLSHGAKLISEGGYENVFKQTFGADPAERLRKSYACYLSTSTGPVPGILYISTHKIAFCSDKPLSYSPAPGQQAVSYYKLAVPIDKLRAVNPSSNPQRPAEKYIQVMTVDNHEFWFMGFVNYDKGVKNLQAALHGFRDTQSAV